MPGVYAGRDYDLAGFAVGAVERGAVLPREVTVGDVIFGLPSSGLHSNGFSLVRRIVARSGLAWSEPAPFASDRTLGEALLVPTRIYVALLLAALRETSGLRAFAHITGGGLPENLPRVLPAGLGAVIDLDAIAVPPVFGWLAETGAVPLPDLLRTFNCGIGMVLVAARDQAAAIEAWFASRGEALVPLGAIEPAGPERIRFTGTLAL